MGDLKGTNGEFHKTSVWHSKFQLSAFPFSFQLYQEGPLSSCGALLGMPGIGGRISHPFLKAVQPWPGPQFDKWGSGWIQLQLAFTRCLYVVPYLHNCTQQPLLASRRILNYVPLPFLCPVRDGSRIASGSHEAERKKKSRWESPGGNLWRVELTLVNPQHQLLLTSHSINPQPPLKSQECIYMGGIQPQAELMLEAP